MCGLTGSHQLKKGNAFVTEKSFCLKEVRDTRDGQLNTFDLYVERVISNSSQRTLQACGRCSVFHHNITCLARGLARDQFKLTCFNNSFAACPFVFVEDSGMEVR